MDSLDKVRRLLHELNLDGILLSRRDSFSWITGGKLNYILNTTEEGVASIYITHDTKFVITSNIEAGRIIDEEIGEMGFEAIVYSWFGDMTNSKFTDLIKGKRIGSDNGVYGSQNIFSDLVEIRSILSTEEQVSYRLMAKEVTDTVEQVCRRVEPGWTEHKIRAEVAREAHERGVNPACILVATDERIFKYRHPIATNKKLDKYLMIVLGGEKYGLNASLTRFVHFGTCPEEIINKNEKLVRIHASMIDATQQGTKYVDFFHRLQDLYVEAGYGEEWNLHHQGGLTGYACREFIVTPETPGEIQLNQAFAWNPSITGTKSEDTFLLTQTGPEVMTRTGNWPMKKVVVNDQVWQFPDILVR